jgi:CRISPR system Cascade subunit CasB
MTEALSEVTETATGSSLGALVARIHAAIWAEHYPNGERAALRRWSLEQPIPLAFYRLWLRHLDNDLPPAPQTTAWMILTWGLANMGQGAHDPKRPLGQALAESKFSEGRLEQLLSAPEDVRPDLFMSAVRFLAAKGERFNWREAAEFLLTQDQDRRESLCRRIATAFYRYQKHQEQ